MTAEMIVLVLYWVIPIVVFTLVFAYLVEWQKGKR